MLEGPKPLEKQRESLLDFHNPFFPVPYKFILPTSATGTAFLRGKVPKACPAIPILPAPVPFLQPPTVERKFHHVKIKPKITTQHHQPE